MGPVDIQVNGVSESRIATPSNARTRVTMEKHPWKLHLRRIAPSCVVGWMVIVVGRNDCAASTRYRKGGAIFPEKIPRRLVIAHGTIEHRVDLLIEDAGHLTPIS